MHVHGSTVYMLLLSFLSLAAFSFTVSLSFFLVLVCYAHNISMYMYMYMYIQATDQTTECTNCTSHIHVDFLVNFLCTTQNTFSRIEMVNHTAQGLYRIAGNIGGELYLADWRISCHTANIKSVNIAPTV